MASRYHSPATLTGRRAFSFQEMAMTDEQIMHMVNRFLAFRLPQDFSPDGGITFKAEFNEYTAHPMKHEPSGTNLLNAAQARRMVEFMIAGLPPSPLTDDCVDSVLSLLDVYAPGEFNRESAAAVSSRAING